MILFIFKIHQKHSDLKLIGLDIFKEVFETKKKFKKKSVADREGLSAILYIFVAICCL